MFCAIVLTLFCLMIIFPFLNVLAISLSSRLSVSQGRVWLWPVGFNLESYKRAFAYDGFLRSYWNTIRYTFMDTVLSLAITMLTAYPLSKSYLRGRKFFNVFFRLHHAVQRRPDRQLYQHDENGTQRHDLGRPVSRGVQPLYHHFNAHLF